MRLDVRPGRPGVARSRRSLEFRGDREPRAARRSDEVPGNTRAVCGGVAKDVADRSLGLGVGVGCSSV
jgi:hypothetical protein